MSTNRPYSLLLACAALTFAAVAGVRGSEISPTAFDTGISLPRPAKGAEAIQMLGANFNKVAALNQMAPGDLHAALHRDHDLTVDAGARLAYTCEGLGKKGREFAARAGQGSGVRGNAASAPPFAETETFRLHSRAISTKTIFLDFDGHRTLDGQGWNNDQAFDSLGWSLDADRAGFNTAEHEVIQRTWQGIADDFAPFDIDVTTEDPGVEALRKTSASDQEFGIRVVISPTTTPQPGAGGVAFLGSFDWPDDVPCYTFTDNIGIQDGPTIAFVSSHEIGHTLGLLHDGLAGVAEYYDGQGNWGPIMGSPYGKAITHWSNGDYRNASNQENDVVVFRTNGGNTNVDDYDDALSRVFYVNSTTARLNGVISTRGDTDLFKFDTGNGPVTATVVPAPHNPNLDIKLELLSSSGSVLTSVDTANFNAAITQNLAIGTYFIRVDGVGAGDPLATGYSDYGSIGAYQIDFSLQASVPPVGPSNLVATAVSSRQIDLVWADNSPNEGSFEVERSLNGVDFAPIGSVGGGIITYSDTPVSSGVEYFYRVRAVNAAGGSQYSNTASATPPYDPPTAPILGSVTLTTPTSVDVDWSVGGGAIDSYEVERREGNAPFGPAGTVPSTTTVLSDIGLTANSTYTYRVRAVGPGGVSPWSNELSIILPPSEPIDLVVTGIPGGFRLNWAHPGNVGYRIERKVGNGSFVQIAQVLDSSAEVEEYINLGFLPGVTATFRVRAFTSAGISIFGNTASGTTTSGVTSFSFAKASASSGTTVQATIEIAPRAPSGGVVVSLSGPRTLSLPTSVRVPAGADRLTFKVRVGQVQKSQLATARANYGGLERSASITLKK